MTVSAIARVAVAIAAGALLGGCTEQRMAVQLYYYNGDDPYIATFVEQIREQADGRIALESFDADNTQSLQNEQIDAGLRRNPSLLIVNPVDRLGAYTIVERAKALEIPVIFFNREPLPRDLESYDGAYYVGARAAQSAILQAELVIDLFGPALERSPALDRDGDGMVQTVILKGEQGHQDAEIRTSEVLATFDSRSFPVDLLATEVANWNRGEAYQVMEDLDRRFGSAIELVVSNNDAMALGAITYLRQVGRYADSNGDGRLSPEDEAWLPVVGIDGLSLAVDQIESGYLFGTVQNDSQTMAEAIVALAETLISEGGSPPLPFEITEGSYIWIDYQPFSRANGAPSGD